MRGARLIGANLTGAHLGGAILVNANLTDARLTGTDLSGINVPIKQPGADLTGATVSQTQLDQACGIYVKLDPGLTIKPCQK